MGPQELSSSLWGYAKLGVAPPAPTFGALATCASSSVRSAVSSVWRKRTSAAAAASRAFGVESTVSIGA